MRCAAEAAQKAAARLNAAASGNTLESAVDDSSSAAASSHPAAHNAAGARGDDPRDDDGSELELIYSGESDGESDSKKNTSPPGSPVADPDRARLTGSGERGAELAEIFGPSDSGDESSYSRRIVVVVVTRLCVSKRGATREIELLPVSALMLTPHKRAETVRSCDALLKWSLPGFHHPGTWTVGQVCPPKGIEFRCSIAGGFALLILARILFVLKRNSSPMYSLSIGGTTATATATAMP